MAQTMKGQKLQEDVVFCRSLDRFIPFVVTECNSFDDKSQPTLKDLYDSAWKVSADKKKKKAGFLAQGVRILNPKEFKQAMRDGTEQETELDEEYSY